MGRTLTCKTCGEPRMMTSARFHVLYDRSSIRDIDIFKSEFICGKCKKMSRLMSEESKRDIKDTYRFQILQNYVRLIYRKALLRGFTPEVVDDMRKIIHDKMLSMGVLNYEYVANGKSLVGIKIKSVPLFGDVYIPFV